MNIMTTAIADGSVVTAGASAPHAATCRKCGGPVRLTETPAGRWSYSHVKAPAEPCARQVGGWITRSVQDPAYVIGLRIIRETIVDGLGGGGIEELVGLFEALPQVALGRLLREDPEIIYERTVRAVRRMIAIVEGGNGYQVRKILVHRGDPQQLEQWFSD